MEITSFLLNPFAYQFFPACLYPGKRKEGDTWCKCLISKRKQGQRRWCSGEGRYPLPSLPIPGMVVMQQCWDSDVHSDAQLTMSLPWDPEKKNGIKRQNTVLSGII